MSVNIFFPQDSEYSQLIKKEQQSHEQTEERLKQAESLAAEKLQILYESRKEFGEKTEHLNKLVSNLNSSFFLK